MPPLSPKRKAPRRSIAATASLPRGEGRPPSSINHIRMAKIGPLATPPRNSFAIRSTSGFAEIIAEINRENCVEIARFEASAADQRPVHLRHHEKLARVLRLDRAAIKDTDAVTLSQAEQAAQLGADQAVHLGHIFGRRRKPSADRPHRLIGDDCICRPRLLRQRTLQLAPHDLEGGSFVPLLISLANADYGGPTCPRSGLPP